MNNLPDKTLVLTPHNLISLWDMNQIIAKDFIEAWGFLAKAVAHSFENRARKATKDEANSLIQALDKIRYQAHQLGLQQSFVLCSRLLDQLANQASHRILTATGVTMPKEAPLPDFESVYWQLQGISTEIEKEMKLIRLVVTENAEFFEQPESEKQKHLFGETVTKAFPSAALDIKDAGNCLALGLKTAAVFHLMRVAEHGLRILAQSPYLNVTLTFPIEFASWGNVIQGCDDKLKQLKPTPKTAAREEELRFYSGLVASARAIQILWRDPVSHIRARFDKPMEAENALQDIHRFMKTLAEKLSE